MQRLAFATSANIPLPSNITTQNRHTCRITNRVRPPFACTPQPGVQPPRQEESQVEDVRPAAVPFARLEEDEQLASLQTEDNASATAKAILDDVAANPEYYLNVAGVLLGLTLSIIVLTATMVALDTLPVVPDVLRMVGLGYLFWFLGKFLFSAKERRRLSNDVDDFVTRVRGTEYRVMGAEDHLDVQLMGGDETS